MAEQRQEAEANQEAVLEDPDDIDLREAEQEAEQQDGSPETEGAGSQSEPSSSETPGASSGSQEGTQHAAGTGEAQTGQQAQQQPYVPKARLDEEIRKRQQAATYAQRLEGMVQAYQRMGHSRADAEAAAQGGDPAAADSGQQARQQPQESVEDLQEQIAKTYDKVDEGELSMAEAKREEHRLQNRIGEMQQSQQQAQQQPQQSGDDLYVEAVTERIEQQNQWFNNIPDELVDNVVTPYAVTLAQRNGHQITPDQRGTLLLRQFAVHAAKDLGFDRRFSGQQATQAAQQPPAQQQGQASQGRAQPNAQDRANKVQQSRQMPPDPGAAGAAATADTVSRDRIMNASDEELERMIESGQLDDVAPSP